MRLYRLFSLLWLVGSIWAQSTPTTNLSGTVTDPTGAVIVSASLELTNIGTHWSHKTASDSQGRFQFSLVPPGAYDLSVDAKGFATVHQEGIRLDADVPATLHLTLTVAATATSVTIHGDAPMVDAQSGTLRQVVGEEYIQDLPLQGRNAAALVYMAPGTVLGKGIDSGTYATNSDT